MQKIKLPYKLLMKLVAQPEILKAYIVWSKLKVIFSNSSVHNWNQHSKKVQIAKTLSISLNTLKKYVSILLANKIVYKEGTILRLGSKLKWNTLFNIVFQEELKETYIRVNELNKCNFYSLRIFELTLDNLKFLSLQLKKEQVEFCQKENISNIILKSYGEINSINSFNKLKSKSKTKASEIYEKYTNDVSYNFLKKNKYGFLDSNLSGKSIAKLFGRISPITGTRFLRKLNNKGLITLERRIIPLVKLTIDTTQLKEKNIILKGGWVCKSLPSSWSMVKDAISI